MNKDNRPTSHLRRRHALLSGAVGIGALVAIGSAAAQTPTFQADTLRLTGDAYGVSSIDVQSRFFGYQSAVDRDITGGEPAYDYSTHLMLDGDRYRLFNGGRYRDTMPGGTALDGDHVFGAYTRNGTRITGSPSDWQGMYPPHFGGQELPSPLFLQGRASGDAGEWFSNNYLEPEVAKVGGTYYMYSQVEIRPGQRVDTGETATSVADRIQLHTSTNGSDWTRFSTAATGSVVKNIDNPAGTKLTHHEVLYNPADETGRPWSMYVGVIRNGIFTGHVRLRSADPTHFDWTAREATTGIAELGNQMGYIKDANGATLFTRITHTPQGDRRVPSLQVSRDGVNWSFGANLPAQLAGSSDDNRNRSTFFLGMSTVDGQGGLEQQGLRRYKVIYGATTANSAVAGTAGGDIFDSEIGIGEMYLTLRLADESKDIAVPDASFETSDVAGFQYQPVSGAWDFNPGSGVTQEDYAFAAGLAASDGEQWGFMQGTTEIAQTLTGLTPGAEYRLEFEAAGRGSNSEAGGEGLLSVLLGDAMGGNTLELLPQTAVPDGEGFITYTADFEAVFADSRLRFMHMPGVADADLSTLIDGVRVLYVGPGSTVPEPATASLAAAASLALLLRRRRA